MKNYNQQGLSRLLKMFTLFLVAMYYERLLLAQNDQYLETLLANYIQKVFFENLHNYLYLYTSCDDAFRLRKPNAFQ